MDNEKDSSSGKKDKNQVESAFNEIGEQMEKFAVKTAESIKKAIDKALASRNTVLTIRVNEDSNKKLNMLVESGLFKSRSESAAFLIEEGIKNQDALFSKIKDKLETIDQIREELKTIVHGESKPQA
jgi:Arc/MetJ-type ribon-helix-helix transcriptional regulator